MIMSRVWAMPSKHTFLVPPLLAIVDKYKMPGEFWIDPFAGYHSPCEATNDLNPEVPAGWHMEAIDFVNELGGDSEWDGAIFDPPYSLTQVSRSYQSFGQTFKGAENPTGGFPRVRDTLSRLVRPGGHVIAYGWNTVGMGKTRGFELIEVLVCSHGGNHNDTLVTVERRVPSPF